ncbi:MAG: hypothetical protein LBT10_08835, partial [Methanobrevibacter sp.]|nr:hypothetical protein [Methanobrevibacter sp.]
GNYLLCKLENLTDKDIYLYLKNKNILIRTCSNYRGLNNQFIRIAINDRESNKKLIKCLNKFKV